MSNSLIKYKDLALKVVYYTKKRQLGNKIFFATSKFQDVLQYFEKNLKDSQTFLKSCYFLNGKQIFPSDILLYFCTVDPNLRLVEEDLFLEIEELEHLDDASEPIYEKLLKPIINPFKLIILNVKEGILQMVDFPKEKLAELGLDTLNNNFACCNSVDSLFLSCGKNFWIISNKNFQIEKKEMPFSKEKHSMTYILSNNTVFIAGGTEDSFYYDINTKEFVIWGKMNGTSEKPALIQFGDFLYSFNSFNQSGIYFEKTKLTNPAKKWEKLVPQSGDQESGFFYNQFFGVSKCSGGNILFSCGINNQLRTFIYNLKLNVLYITPSKDESILLTERNFYKIDHNFNIAIPVNIEKDHIVAIVNKNSKTLNLIPFEQIGIKTRNNLLQFDNPRNRLPGNIVIQCRYMALKDYENFLKAKEAQQNNTKTKSGFDIYNRKEQGKKVGDKLNGDPYKYQYRGKTPLSLERISEGKIEEENDEDDLKKEPKSNSAKKEKRNLDLGIKLENVGKYNFATEKREEEKNVDNKNVDKNDKNIMNNNKLMMQIQEQKNNTNNINNNLNIKNNNNINHLINENEEKDQNFQQILKDANNKETIDKKENNNEDKVYNSETNKSKNRKSKQAREVKHKKINLNLEKKEDGKNNDSNLSNISSTPPSTLTQNTPISRSYHNVTSNPQGENANINSNININNNKIKKNNLNNNINYNINNNEINKGIPIGNNNNIEKNINMNNFSKIKREENDEIIKSNQNTPNSILSKESQIINNNSSKGNINQRNQNNLNRNMTSLNSLNNNKNNNNNLNNNMNDNININDQKRMGSFSKNNNNNIPNLKSNHQNPNNVILKSNTSFIPSSLPHKNENNQDINKNYSTNPFIDNSKYQNIGEKESYQFRDESEPNANKIITSKTKTIKSIKKTQQKQSYNNNTVTSTTMVDNQQIITESIPNNNNINNQSSNFKMISYKTSTHKQIKGKKITNLNQNPNNIKMNINHNEAENLNFSENPKNLKNMNKKDLTPDQKISRNISANRSNFINEGNTKILNYTEMYIKHSNIKIQQNFAGQRQNTVNNISTSNNNIINNNFINNANNSVRINKSSILNNQHNFSNEKIIRGGNNMKGNDVIITKDGKKYILSKNVQRFRKEEDMGGQRKIDEKRKIPFINDGNKNID